MYHYGTGRHMLDIATIIPPNDRVKYLSPLLQDQLKSIRITAARTLVTSEISAGDQPLFDKAFKALIHSNNINSWRGEGNVNQGVLAIEMNQISEAENSFKNAMTLMPNNAQLKELGLYLSQKLNNRKDVDYFNSI